MSTELLKVAERAKREPDARFNFLAHLVDEAALGRAFHRIRKDVAVGVDGITKEQYGQQLEGNLLGLHGRLRTMRYRHQPIRRVHIPKAGGKTRPIGISTVEDKIVQGARVADPPFLRLIGKCLNVGVLDLWFERDIKPRLKGHARLIRFAEALRCTGAGPAGEAGVWE